MRLAIEPLNKPIHIVATPVGAREQPPGALVRGKGGAIRKIESGAPRIRIRIEVVIQVHGIHLVATQHIGDHRDGLILYGAFTRIEPQLRAVASR